ISRPFTDYRLVTNTLAFWVSQPTNTINGGTSMEGRGFKIDQSGASQQTVNIPQEHNSLVVRLQGHTWVSVSTDTQQLVHTQSLDPIIAFTLAPGTYVVRTDGKLESLTTESFRQAPSLFEQLRQGT